jgi:hypothetical protein
VSPNAGRGCSASILDALVVSPLAPMPPRVAREALLKPAMGKKAAHKGLTAEPTVHFCLTRDYFFGYSAGKFNQT